MRIDHNLTMSHLTLVKAEGIYFILSALDVSEGLSTCICQREPQFTGAEIVTI